MVANCDTNQEWQTDNKSVPEVFGYYFGRYSSIYTPVFCFRNRVYCCLLWILLTYWLYLGMCLSKMKFLKMVTYFWQGQLYLYHGCVMDASLLSWLSWLCHGYFMAVSWLCCCWVMAVSWLCLGYLMGVSWLCCDCCIWSIYAWLSSRWEQRSTDGVWAPQADRSCNKRSDSAPRGVLSLLPRCGEGEHRRLEVHVWGRRSSNKRCSHWLMMCLWYCWLFVILLAVCDFVGSSTFRR